MKKIMVSQPMSGLSNEEILATRERAIEAVTKMGYSFENSLHMELWDKTDAIMATGVVNLPLYWMSMDIEAMSRCHAVYFVKGWEKARGCRVEHELAKTYDLECIYEEE